MHFRGWRRIRWDQQKPLDDSDYKPNYEQKGVDMQIGLDIATFSYERTVERIILVTGDTDFIPAMKMAHRSGLQVVLVQLVATFPCMGASTAYGYCAQGFIAE